jgi:hypothetical protein
MGKKGDPFSLPPGVRTKMHVRSEERDGEKPEEESTTIKVNAILTQGSRRVAAVGRHVVEEGDWIGDEEVVRIEEDRVVLRQSGQVRELVLQQSDVPLTVVTGRTRR